MAKIDITKIEGYENMTPEQKLAALEGFEYEDNSAELERYKNAVSKANSEAADWKKKYNAQLSEDERNKQASEDELKTLRDRVAEMEKKELVATHKAQFLALGYDEALADETAKAMAEGNTEKVFANQKKFLETHDKTLKAEILKTTPTPPAGKETDAITLEDLRKMTPKERFDFSVEHPDEYKKLYGGNN